jgi:paraquat-inducible protein B
MSYIERQLNKNRNEFNSKVWILRIISLSIALAAVLYYLDQHHKGNNILVETPASKVSDKKPYMRMQIPVGRGKDSALKDEK